MRKITPFLIVSSILLLLIACQKEQSLETKGATPGTGGSSGGGGSTNGTEVGTWKYLYAKQVFNQSVEANAGIGVMKSVSSADFTTINNSGTIKFDGATADVTNLATSIDATMKVSSYLGGTLLSSQDVPITGSLPASSYTTTYKKIGTDSLYFPDGLIDLGGSGASSANGYKLKWVDDKMTLTEVFDDNTTEVVNGISAKVVEHTVTVITLQKQ
jgi:hypothetical protein